MEELREKANSYVEENINNVLKEAFAKVYADGYRDGYKDHEDEISIDLQDGEIEFVDLGLPSGTMWSSDYKMGDDNLDYFPYEKAELLNIPTQEQWEELKDNCEWEFDIDNAYDLCEARCVGPNGNTLRFVRTGKKNIESQSEHWEVFFWIKDNKEGNNKNAVHMYNWGKQYKQKNGTTYIDNLFCGYKLPVRLVKAK